MAMIGPAIALADISNCEAFVQRTIDKSGIEYGASEREELLAEGLTILYELHGKYKPLPMRPGIDRQAGRFSGYAAMFLPRRLGDAWHKWHPEHRYVTDPETGLRGWRYERPMLSLDQITSTDPDGSGGDGQLLHAKALSAFCHATRMATRVGSAIAPR